MSEFTSFWGLSHVPLYVFSMVFVYLFVHSSVGGHWDCFLLLAVANDAAVNVGVPISLQDCAFNSFEYMELLGHVVVLVLIFWGATMLFSIAFALFCIPTNSARGFQFFYILANTWCFWGVCLLVFNGSHPNGCGQAVLCV